MVPNTSPLIEIREILSTNNAIILKKINTRSFHSMFEIEKIKRTPRHRHGIAFDFEIGALGMSMVSKLQPICKQFRFTFVAIRNLTYFKGFIIFIYKQTFTGD